MISRVVYRNMNVTSITQLSLFFFKPFLIKGESQIFLFKPSYHTYKLFKTIWK